ncbi:hypothetical protein HXX76_008010 [Chlamydomonas incerta]|uniref:Uncharacterized protein n=1 Tax=Chlamydomonas incerta TaxID=51695 RepID=A0A835T9W9_CHLIN|nr:hypothetical protein HXX76_008010 [Chlamydomonas incerta]|eukprot:KAG2434286.1 hypothetical protein HXX76_008010 [Chlamydomonas incerta]
MDAVAAEECAGPASRISENLVEQGAGRKRPREDASEVVEPRAGGLSDVPESGSGSHGGERAVGSKVAALPATAGSTGEEHAAPLTAATAAPDPAEGPALGAAPAAASPFMLPMMMMLMGMGSMPFFSGTPPNGRAPFMPPAFMPALCQLLLVYIQRATYLAAQPQPQPQQLPGQPGAAKPAASNGPGIPPSAADQPHPESGATPSAATKAPEPAAAAAKAPASAPTDQGPAQRPEPQRPPAVVAVSQLQGYGIPVPSLLQAAAHLMVVGALSPVQYQEIQMELGPIAAQEGQAALAADGGVNAAAAAVAAAAAAVRSAAAPAGTAAAGIAGAKPAAAAAAAVLTPAAAAALAAAGGSGLLRPAASGPAVARTFGALDKAAPAAAGFSGKLDPVPRQQPDTAAAEPALLPTVSWPGRGGVQSTFRLGLGRRLFCAVADQLPTNTELDCILPPMYGFSGVLYKIKDSAEVGAALWDGAEVRDLGPYTSAQDARQSVVMSIKLLAAAAAAAPQPAPSGRAFTASGALPGAPSLRSGPSVRSGGVRIAAAGVAAEPAPPLAGGGARRGPLPAVPVRDGTAGLGGHGGAGSGRGWGRGAKANGRGGLGPAVPGFAAPGLGPGLPGAALDGAEPEPAEADVLEAADQLLKLRSEGSGRIRRSNSPEPLPLAAAAAGLPALLPPPALDALVGAELGTPPLPSAVAAQLQTLPGKQRSLAALAAADDPMGLPAALAAPAGLGLAGLQQLPDAGGGAGGRGSRTGSGSGRSGGAVAADELQDLPTTTVTGRLASGTPGPPSLTRQPPAGPLGASQRELGPMHARTLAAAAASSALPEAAGGGRALAPPRAPPPPPQQQQRRDAAVVDLTSADLDVKPQLSPRGANGGTPPMSKPGSSSASQAVVDSEAAALVALISSGRLHDMDRAQLEALVAGSSGPALLAALQSLPQDLVAAAAAAEAVGAAGTGAGPAGGHEAEAGVQGERGGGQAGAAPPPRQRHQLPQAAEQRRVPGWEGDGLVAGKGVPGLSGVLRLGRAEAGSAAGGDEGAQHPGRAGAAAAAADDGDDCQNGVLVLGGADGKDGLRGAGAPRGRHDGADEAAAGAARRHHATDQEAALLQQLQELAGQAQAQAHGGALSRQRPPHQEPPMRGGAGPGPGPGPGGLWAGPPQGLQGRAGGQGDLRGAGRGGLDPRDEAMDVYASAVAAAVQQQQHLQRQQQHQRHLQHQLQQHLAAGRLDGAGGAGGGHGPRGRPGVPERLPSSGGLGGLHAVGAPGPGPMLGGGPRGGSAGAGAGASPLLPGRRGGDIMLGLPLGLDGGGGGGAMPRYGGPLHGMAAARGRFSPYDSPHVDQQQQQLSEPAELLLQRLQAGRAAGALRLQQPGPGGDGRRMAPAMYGRPPGSGGGGGGGGGGGASMSGHDGTGAYTTSGRTSSQPTYGASYSTHGSRGRDVSGGASAEAALGDPSSSPYQRLAGVSGGGVGLGGLGGAGLLLGSGLSGLPPAGGRAPPDESPSGSGSGGLGARLGGPGELDAATGAEPTPKRQRSGVTREFSAVTNLVGLGLQEALAIVRQRQGPHS